MLLNLDSAPVSMKRVYLLSEELKHDPQRVQLAQQLTLDASRPLMGLKGTHGLFASEVWWDSIKEKKIPLEFISGVIKRAYIAGQDEDGVNNTVDLVKEDGAVVSVGIYTNNIKDVELFKPGSTVSVVYAFDELKRQPARDGGINYSKVALEMAVSES
jgi:hypothetical protein